MFATDNHIGHREIIAAVEINEKATSINQIMKLILENKHNSTVLEL